jgi:hypothetical protein
MMMMMVRLTTWRTTIMMRLTHMHIHGDKDQKWGTACLSPKVKLNAQKHNSYGCVALLISFTAFVTDTLPPTHSAS